MEILRGTAGWTLKSLVGGRNLFFMAARPGFFRIAFMFGDKAIAAIEASDLPKALVESVRSARKYVEGRGLTIEVRTAEDAVNVRKLIAVKMRK